MDADGVALAAIQGLNRKLEAELAAKTVEIELLKRKADEVEALAARLAEIERMLEDRR